MSRTGYKNTYIFSLLSRKSKESKPLFWKLFLTKSQFLTFSRQKKMTSSKRLADTICNTAFDQIAHLLVSKLTNRYSIYFFVFLRRFSQIFWKLNKKRTPLFSLGSSCFSWWNCSASKPKSWVGPTSLKTGRRKTESRKIKTNCDICEVWNSRKKKKWAKVPENSN